MQSLARMLAVLVSLAAALAFAAPTQAAGRASAPRSVAASPAQEAVKVTWVAPADNGGSRIKDYRIQYRRASSSTWKGFADGVSTRLRATVTGLVAGRAYEVRVAAVTRDGRGAWSAVRRATPAPSCNDDNPYTNDFLDGGTCGHTPLLLDLDADGHFADASQGGSPDCDDNDNAIFPGADEALNGLDDDCDGTVDEGTCDDGNPYTEDIPDGGGSCDNVPQQLDLDGDGHDAGAAQGGSPDCDDTDAAIHPGATEAPNLIDDDCDGSIDEGACDDGNPYTNDFADGFGGCAHETQLLDFDGDGHFADAAQGGSPDCDDTDAAIHPDATEEPNLIDDDCDGSVDEGL